MAKTDIWMPLYVADYLSSTTRLTTEQHGAYLLLIIDYWKSGRLPDDDSVLANVTRLNVDTWAKHRGVLQGFFEVNNGEWVHSRIEKELEKSGDLKKAQIKKSILGNFAKYGKIDPRVETDPDLKEWWANQSLKHSHRDSTKAPPSPSPSPSSSKKEKTGASAEIVFPEGLDQQAWTRWLEYRKASGKALKSVSWPSAMQSLAKHKDQQSAVVDQSIANGWQGLFAIKQDTGKQRTSTTFAERDAAAGRKRWEEMTGRKWPENETFIEAETFTLGIEHGTTD